VENPGDGEGMRVGRRKIRKKGSRLRKKMVKEGKQARISRYRWTAKIASVPIGAGIFFYIFDKKMQAKIK
jgi:hypothetical protein